MEHETNRRFEAWLDDERCVISFHSIPDARYFTAPEPVFWPAILELVLSGYRIQKKFREI